MINRGLLRKSLRETFVVNLLFSAGFFTFEAILAGVLPALSGQAGGLLQMPFLRTLIGAMLGMDMEGDIGLTTLSAFAWVHPVVLSLVWAQEIVFCTRVPAGEIDRGTLDMVLALPVSRWEVLRTETALWLFYGLFTCTCGVAGSLLGTALAGSDTGLGLGTLLPIVFNLFAMWLAVGGLAFLASCMASRRGPASGLVFALVLLSFFINFLQPLWPPARHVAFLSLLRYYKPMSALSGAWAWSDMATLAALGIVCWICGGLVFQRRDIPSV